MRWYGPQTCLGMVLACLTLLGPAQAAQASSVQYNGGPVSHSMQGVLVDWGSSVSSVYTDPSSGDPGLIKYLAAQSGSTSDVGGVLAQYMDSSGHNAANQVGYGGQYQITPGVTSSTLLDSQISSELVNQIQGDNLPRPTGTGLSTIYLVVFPPGDTECIDSQTCSGTNFCAYHSSTALPDGTQVLYAVLPDNTTGPMTQGCGSATTPLQNQTSYLTHEWSETITDPLGNGWWDSSTNGTGNEIGDWCNQYMAQNGGWTVQEEWSNLDSNCLAAEPAYTAPTASFLGSSTAAPNQLVSFDASSSSDPAANRASAQFSGASYSIGSGVASYSWDWGDGTSPTTATTASASHMFSTAGTYQVSLTVTDALGFTSTITHSISVSGTPLPLPPSVSTGAASAVDSQGASVLGQINPHGQPVSYHFSYGTSPGSLTQSTPDAPGPTGVSPQPVSATLSGLAASTTYYYQLVVLAGSSAYTGVVESFTTSAAPPPPQAPAPQNPTPATGSATRATPSGAVLNGSVNPGGAAPVSYWFAYGTSADSLTETTAQQTVPGGTVAASVSATLDGLQPATTYYYELEASLDGTTYTGQVQSLTTGAPTPGLRAGAATAITSSSATITGSVDPNGAATTYFVEFGRTAAYGHSTAPLSAPPSSGSVAVSISLAGLRASTTYHYRLVASSAGGTVTGPDAILSTHRAPAPPPHFGFRAPHRLPPRAILSRRLRLHYHCNRACTVHFVITTTSSRLARSGAVPITLARGNARLIGAGTGTARLRFVRGLATRLVSRRHRLRLVISGYVVGTGGQPSPPQAAIVAVG